MKIGIYGGTFNPPHLGHMAAAQTALQVLNLDKLIFIPAATPPHKALPGDTPRGEHRLAMVRKMADAMGGRPGQVEVSPMEMDRGGKSYTSETLAALQKDYPQAELWLLMGSDMFLTLHLWHDIEAIAGLAGICAFGRTEQEGEETFLQQQRELQKNYQATIVLMKLPNLVDISSTQLRELLARDRGSEYLLPAVWGYILRHHLYGTEAVLKELTLPQLRACAYSMMRAKRIPHVMGVEEEAVRLAKFWGGDPELARHAAILHDCTKYFTPERQLELCFHYGIIPDPLEQEAIKLLHSKTGACMARHIFGEPDEVYEAIFCHTTGRVKMKLLDKILYLADYIEPNRKFEGVERLRELAYTNLDQAVLLGLEYTIQEMEERGLPIHTNTLQAKEWLLSRGIALGE